jgi:hypothetical protein
LNAFAITEDNDPGSCLRRSLGPHAAGTRPLPDGRTQELTAAEIGLATLTLKDGTEYGFRDQATRLVQFDRPVQSIS